MERRDLIGRRERVAESKGGGGRRRRNGEEEEEKNKEGAVVKEKVEEEEVKEKEVEENLRMALKIKSFAKNVKNKITTLTENYHDRKVKLRKYILKTTKKKKNYHRFKVGRKKK